MAPEFGDIEPSKSASDWNDLAYLKGKDIAKSQLAMGLSDLIEIEI